MCRKKRSNKISVQVQTILTDKHNSLTNCKQYKHAPEHLNASTDRYTISAHASHQIPIHEKQTKNSNTHSGQIEVPTLFQKWNS